jgi:hypothetical protein
MEEVYYKRVGRKYVEVARGDVHNSFPLGASLVIAEPGVTTKFFKIDPAVAPMVAASQGARRTMSKVLMDELSLRSKTKPYTEEQIAAWRKLSETFGEELHPLMWPSVYSAVEAAIKVLQEDAHEMLKYPAVKKAYEDFLLVYKLTKEENESDS